MNITRFNLNEQFDEIEKNLQTCSFIAVDAEFSGLPSLNNKNSLFDSTAQRYAKLRNGVEGVIFTQVGISAFHYNREKNGYVSTTYNFYLCPSSVGNINQICTFQSSALDFLTTHKFDFNKIMYEGIPYLNKCEECMLRRDLNTGDLELLLDLEHSELLLSCNAQLSQWLTTAKEGETFELTGSPVLCYLMTTKLKAFFPKLTIQNKGFEVSVINTKESIRGPEDKQNDEDIFVNHCLGFSRIVKVMEKVKKPLVFHNALTDLLIFFHQFLDPLPTRYESFKHSVHQTFPIIYDTKFISNEMKFIVKKERFSESTCLATLYKFFSSSRGLQLALHSPSITMKDVFEVTPQFHEAGFDSYCTGYCFIRLCHWSACQLQGSDHVMSSTEHLNSLKKYCNRINISRAAQLYISLDSDDPPKHRPEFLHVEMFGDRKLNVAQIVCHLSKHGSIDVKKYGQNSALVAVTNNICAQNILAELNKDWKVARYNTLKHSPVARMALWSSFVVSSGSLIAYLIHKMA